MLKRNFDWKKTNGKSARKFKNKNERKQGKPVSFETTTMSAENHYQSSLKFQERNHPSMTIKNQYRSLLTLIHEYYISILK